MILQAILHARGVVSCLTYLDFFGITAQRNALSITANCCSGLLPEEFVHVQVSVKKKVAQNRKLLNFRCICTG